MKAFVPILFVVLAAGIVGFWTYPQYQKIQVKQADAAHIEEANQKAAQLRAYREKLTKQRNDIKDEDLERLNKMVPEGVENVRLVIDIDNIAKRYGMNVKNPRISDSASSARTPIVGPDGKKFGNLSMTFTVTNTYENFLLFMKDLESSLRLVDISDLQFTPSQKADGRYDFSITLQTYWLK